jgi:hypothetical protein
MQANRSLSFFLGLFFLVLSGLVLGSLSVASPAQESARAPGARAAFDSSAELPRVYVKSSLADTPAPGKIHLVKADGDLQEAINHAVCGDTVELQAGATFSGKFVFPSKKCDDSHWIVLRTSAADSDLPPEGKRLTPCYAGVSSLPGRPEFGCSSTRNVMAKIEFGGRDSFGPIVFASGANHYRFIGLEVTRAVPEQVVSNLISLEREAIVEHLVFDRMWIHGLPHAETARGIQFAGSRYVAVVDSFFSDFHCMRKGTCVDSQAVSGGSGDNPMGPYKIENNFLEAAAEDIIFGGSRATTTPADIVIRHNHMFRPLNWKPGNPNFIGGPDGQPFIVKNLFELKNAQRVLLEGNILENTWGGFTQKGFAIVLTPKNQSNGTDNICPLCQVTDVTIRYNRIMHMASGFQIANIRSDTGGASTDGGRYSIHDNILEDIDPKTYDGMGNFIMISGKVPPLHDVVMDHNTGFAPNALLNVGGNADGPKMSNFVFTNNLVAAGDHQVESVGGITNCARKPEKLGPTGVLENCFVGFKFTHNAIVGGSGWPKDNISLRNLEAVGFANLREGRVDYHLRPDSRIKHAGTDGRDLGADIDALDSATTGVR